MTKWPCHLPLLASMPSVLPAVVKAPPLTRCPEPCVHPASALTPLPCTASSLCRTLGWVLSGPSPPVLVSSKPFPPPNQVTFTEPKSCHELHGSSLPQEKATGLRFSGGSLQIWSGMISPLPSSAAPSITPAITIVRSFSLSLSLCLCGHCLVPSHLLGFLQFPVGFSHGSLSPCSPSPFCHLQPGWPWASQPSGKPSLYPCCSNKYCTKLFKLLASHTGPTASPLGWACS